MVTTEFLDLILTMKTILNIIDTDPNDEHQFGDFVYVYDINNTKDGAWTADPVDMGIVGINILEHT